MRLIAAALLFLLAAAPARDRVPAATPAGKPVDCLRLTDIRQSLVRDDRTIDFVTAGRRVYRVTLPQACPTLGFEQRFAYRTSLGRLCSTDIITVLQSPGLQRGASCGMAPFQPVTLAPR
jgi:hypothetical protein